MAEKARRKRPGGELSSRPLHFIWLVDCSGSMAFDGKIQALNNAVREAIPHMRRIADENPYAAVLVRTMCFSSGAEWHLAEPTPVGNFEWTDVEPGGVTDLGHGLTLVSEQLQIPPMTDRALPPVLVLLSDGQPTDDYESALRGLLALPWGKKSVRIAIAIGEDADHEVLQRFIANPELKPLKATNPEALVAQIKWVSTAVLQSASAPSSQTSESGEPVAHVPIPTPPAEVTDGPDDAADVW